MTWASRYSRIQKGDVIKILYGDVQAEAEKLQMDVHNSVNLCTRKLELLMIAI